jgi:hypothetical protein
MRRLNEDTLEQIKEDARRERERKYDALRYALDELDNERQREYDEAAEDEYYSNLEDDDETGI